MGKHRSRLRILANILSVINESNGAKKTQIMYQAYLSYKLLIQYLSDMTEVGLIECLDGKCYKATKKGNFFLTKFIEYSKHQKNLKKQFDHVENQRSILEKMSSTV